MKASLSVLYKSNRLAGRLLKKKTLRAIKGFAFHQRLWKEFTQDIPQASIDEWTAMAEAWEKDCKSEDPYYLAPSGELYVSSVINDF